MIELAEVLGVEGPGQLRPEFGVELREMRAAGETALNRTLGTVLRRIEARSLHVSVAADELRRLTDDELEARLAARPAADAA